MKKHRYSEIKPMKILKPLACTVMLAFTVIAAMAYQRGVYDISFIKRPAAITDDSQGNPNFTPDANLSDTDETTALNHPSTPPDNGNSSVNGTPTVTLSRAEQISRYIASLDNTSALKQNGYEITDRIYGDGFTLGILSTEFITDNSFSLRERTVQVPMRIPDGEYSGYTTEITEVSEERPLVEIYMDYILVDNGSRFDLYQNDGALLIKDFDAEAYVPAYTRDKNNTPLFKAEEPSKYNPRYTVTRYYAVDSNGELKLNNYSDAADGRGLYYNYPSYFGKNTTHNVIHYSSTLKLYGYGSESGVKSSDNFRYIAAYPHSEGLCAAVETDGLMYYLDENMVTQISASVEFYENYGNTRRKLLRELILPDTFGEESLGFFYFDHGLCRVRAQTIDAWHWRQYQRRYINSDEDILIRTDGTEFPIPTDYTLVSYSNGILLLEKNGYYGYMDYTGKWITDPIYTYAKPFFEGLAAVGNQGSIGVIDTDGNIVVDMLFDHVSNASGGLISVFDDECGWFVLNKLQSGED